MLYEVEGDTEDMEEIGLIAYNHIGNKNTRLYRATLNVNCEDGSIELPCNVSINEAVELAKKFGTDDSASFVNGVLAKFV